MLDVRDNITKFSGHHHVYGRKGGQIRKWLHMGARGGITQAYELGQLLGHTFLCMNVNKMPEFCMIFARKIDEMPELGLYMMIICPKICFQFFFFGGGGQISLCPISYAVISLDIFTKLTQ